MSLQAGREWTVYERDAEVEPHARRIRCRYDFAAGTPKEGSEKVQGRVRCRYDFVAASGERATQARPARDRARGGEREGGSLRGFPLGGGRAQSPDTVRPASPA